MDKRRNVRPLFPLFSPLSGRIDPPICCRYLKSIDKFHEWTVSAWLTPGGSLLLLSSLFLFFAFDSPSASVFTGVKIVLLHELKNDDGIRLFFQEVWETYVKVRSPSFLPSRRCLQCPPSRPCSCPSKGHRI
jgi:hypothetical protein